jgi:hypothetical protein
MERVRNHKGFSIPTPTFVENLKPNPTPLLPTGRSQPAWVIGVKMRVDNNGSYSLFAYADMNNSFRVCRCD